MQIKEGHHLLECDDLTRQLFVVLRQHGGEFTQRGRQHAEERRQGNQHHDDDDSDGYRAANAPAQKPGDQRIKHNGKKERQQELNYDVGGRMDTRKDNHQTGEF